MMTPNLILRGLFTVFFFSAAAEAQVDNPPPVIPGAVDENDSRFDYSSDADSSTMSIANQVCNKHDKGLVFVWEKARLARGIFNPLPPGTCQGDPHPVSGIRAVPDYDAPLYYTQSRIPRSAAIYLSEDSTTNREINSKFVTVFDNKNNESEKVSVDIVYRLDKDVIGIEVFTQPHDLIIGLSNNDWIASQKYSSLTFDQIVNSAAQSELGMNIELTMTYKLLNNDDLDWLPKSMQETPILAISGSGEGENKRLNITIPLKEIASESIVVKEDVLYVLDSAGQLIGTGAYSKFAPKE